MRDDKAGILAALEPPQSVKACRRPENQGRECASTLLALPIVVAAALGALWAAVFTVGGPSALRSQGGRLEAAPVVSIDAFPRWGPSPAGAWTPYLVRLENKGSRDVEGDVVLVPNPPPAPGSPPVRFGSPPSVVALGGTGQLFGLEYHRSPGRAVPAPPVWPSYRTHVTVAAGGAKTLTTLVVESPFGYRAELQDRSGRTVGSEPAHAVTAAVRTRWAVAVMTHATADDILSGEAVLGFASQSNVSRLGSPEDFPDDPLLLSGLQAVVIADFDTAELSQRQIQALQGFVGLGGSLVLGGGAAWSSTLASLPDQLVPLRPSATSTSPVDFLAEGQPKGNLAATVAVGDSRRGRPVRQAPDGTPLVVEAEYGSGHVVQLAYDPFTGPFGPGGTLAGRGLEEGLAHALSHLGFGASNSVTNGPGSIEDLWRPLLAEPAPAAWPQWPAWGVGLLGAYVLLVGPLNYLMLRRRRSISRLTIPVLAVLFGGFSGVAAATGQHGDAGPVDNLVEVQMLGPDGTALVYAYHGLPEPGGEIPVTTLPRGAGVSSVITQPALPVIAPKDLPPAFAVAFAQPVPGGGPILRRTVSTSPVRPAPEGTVHIGADGRPELRLGRVRRGEVGTLQTLSVEHLPGGLEADLRVSISPTSGYGRVTGTVTNDTGRRVRSLQVDVYEGLQARLADVIEAGTTIRVDAPLTPFQRVSPTPDGSDEFVLSAAADFSAPRPGQAAVVGFTNLAPGETGPSGRARALHLVMQIVPVERVEKITDR